MINFRLHHSLSMQTHMLSRISCRHVFDIRSNLFSNCPRFDVIVIINLCSLQQESHHSKTIKSLARQILDVLFNKSCSHCIVPLYIVAEGGGRIRSTYSALSSIMLPPILTTKSCAIFLLISLLLWNSASFARVS